MGALLYISTFTPIPQRKHQPAGTAHGQTSGVACTLLKGVLRYLAATHYQGITCGKSTTAVEDWTDAYYTSRKDTRLSHFL